ncbi:hypothetical protein COL21_31250 [Bacillus thuringiensis]|nr:hypothetical protein COL21_31250 [Bacillus thuringiensis]PGR90507.1 hypothetical protein COC68_26170 [Bacillus thuringiensis]
MKLIDATRVRIEAIGAAGGRGDSINGLGISIQGDVPVTPGEVLNILIGQQGPTSSLFPSFNSDGG